MLDGIIVAAQSEFQLDGLLETFEAPVALVLLEGGNSQKLIDRLFWIVCLQLLSVIVLVLDVDIAALWFIVVFVFKVIPASMLASNLAGRLDTYCSGSESCIKSSSSDIVTGDRVEALPLLVQSVDVH